MQEIFVLKSFEVRQQKSGILFVGFMSSGCFVRDFFFVYINILTFGVYEMEVLLMGNF